MLELPKVLAIDIAAYAIMSNHYHVVLHINTARAKNWTDHKVVERWHQLFNGTVLSQKYLKNEGQFSKFEGLIFQETIDKWRFKSQALLDEDQWFEMTSNFEGCFSSFVGGESSLRMACENLHYQRPPGLATCKLMFR